MARSWIFRLAVILTAGRLLSPVFAQLDIIGSSLVPIETLTTVIVVATSTRSTAPEASSSGTVKEPKEHYIKVGAGGFKFEPESISNVSVGDTVKFEFYPTGHSVVRAEFGSACVPYEYTGREKIGFYSGPMTVDAVSETKFWSILINSTEPIFFYCGADTSCDIHLMVGAINPNGTQSLAAQKNYAEDADWKLIPGDPIPEEGQSTLSIPSSTPIPTATLPPVVHHSDGSSLSGGAIAGIVVGAVAFLVICAALFFYVGRSKSLKEMLKRQDANAAHAPGNSEMGHSQYGPNAPGLQQAPYGSPNYGQTDYYGNQLPAYGQHNATGTHPSAWTSPSIDPHHMSTGSAYDGMSQEQLDGIKQLQALQATRAELHSPTHAQGAHELEVPRGHK